jgi:hypothetical protein
MMRFDERRLRKDDGNDFRDFVREYLRASTGYGYPIPRDSGSVDGCIDLYCEKENLIVECKFVGANVKDESARVEQEWNSVRDKLDHNLTVRDGEALTERAPYQPWGDAKNPIKRYVFATSARLANQARHRNLEGRIKGFFETLASTRSGYEHLWDLSIEVLDWTEISARLIEHPALVFKWLKQWPEGFAELDEARPAGFRTFFYGETLPYLARDCWSAPNGLVQPWTEATLVDDLTKDETPDPIVVLIGKGGVGKTRLGLECSRRMRELGWWTVRCNGLNATTAGLRRLLEESSTPKRILLFVDYLETWPAFEAFASDVLELLQSSGHKIRIIATCRTSFRDRLAAFMKIRNVGGDAAIEVAYSAAVTRHILSAIGTTDTDSLAQKCRDNFALAAFLAFLRCENPIKFVAELSELRAEPSFEAWIVKRLNIAGLKNLMPAAAILAACEFSVTGFDALAASHGGSALALQNVLVSDKWIERRESDDSSEAGPVWAAFHDIFVDVVLVRALESAPDLDEALDRLLEHAAANGVLRQTLTSLGRLRQSQPLLSVDWFVRLIELNRRKPGILADFAAQLLASPLLSPETRAALIMANTSLEKAIAHDPKCDLGLARTASETDLAYFNGPEASRFNQTIVPLLDKAVARERELNIILRLAFRVRPDRYRDDVRRWLDIHPRAFQTQFLLKGWLDQAMSGLKVNRSESSLHVVSVAANVTEWLLVFNTKKRASFVFASWLNAAAAIKDERSTEMVDRVADHLAAWLAHRDHAISDDAQFILTSWLHAAASIKGEYALGMVDRIAVHVVAWLEHDGHGTSSVARFALANWLDVAATVKGERAAEMVDRVAAHVDGWLAHGDHAISDEARFVFASWLDAAAAIKGERAAEMVDRVVGHVDAWLAHDEHKISDLARFVFTSWLDAAATVKGARAMAMVDRVADHVTAWFAHYDHAISNDAQFVLTSWLDAAAAIKGELAAEMVDRVTDYVNVWLAHSDHEISETARFVFASWLDAAAAIKGVRAGEMVDRVAGHVAKWLAHEDNAISEEARFVLASWLEASSASQLRRFESETINWILLHEKGEGCDFVLETWLDNGLEFAPVAQACFVSVRRLCDKPDATFILKFVVRKQNLPVDIVSAALNWCARFPGHEDASSRLTPLVSMDRASDVGFARVTSTAATVLLHLKPTVFVADRFMIVYARALLGALFEIGVVYPPAEKLARIYLVRWLRDGRVFRPTSLRHADLDYIVFDQRFALLESLLTIMTHEEFQPALNRNDMVVLECFCEWGAQWDHSHLPSIRGLVVELVEQFGLPDLWQRMLSVSLPPAAQAHD